jgi:hypothetical protein
MLLGHRYLPSVYFPNPFAVPSFEFDLGFGSGVIEREFAIGGRRSLKFGTLGPKIEAQIKLLNSLVLIAGLSGNVIFGLNEESIAYYGGAARYRPRLGLLWQLIKAHSTGLSLGLEWEKPQTIHASPVDAVTRAAEARLGGEDAPLTDTVEVNRWRPTLRWAYSFGPVIAFNTFFGADIDSENFNDVRSHSTRYLGGISLDTDFNPWVGVPIGLSANFKYTNQADGDSDPTYTYTMGMFETFSKNFNAGLEVGQATSGEDKIMVGALVTRYYY